VAVAGFNGIPTPFAPVAPPPLTTIRAPFRDVARTAVALLAARVAGEDVPAETRLPVSLAAGDTA
jgi:DNA-binding LacI/PurR family transcriptional regulator